VTISQDALLGTLLFLLPGFITVGAYVLPVKWLNSPDLSKNTFVILALSLSVPINWTFTMLARLSPGWLTVYADVPRLTSKALSQPELLGLTLLYLYAVALGLVAAFVAGRVRTHQWNKAGTCVRLSRDSVWHQVLKTRKAIPWVLALTDKNAYYGKLKHYTTTTDDPHVYLTDVQLIPLHSPTGFPLMSQAQQPAMEGVLLQLESLTAMWIITP
jgi:hypothetical protein